VRAAIRAKMRAHTEEREVAMSGGDAAVWHGLRAVGLEFLDSAPQRFRQEAVVAASRAEVFDALADASGWAEWFPGVEWARYAGSGEPGVGTIRESQVAGARYDETMLVWEAGRRWGYRIDRATQPVARAQVELHELEDAAQGTLVRWIIATEPDRAIEYMADGTPFPVFLTKLHEDAMRGLERRLRGTTQRSERGV
jgi:uncharacterized protein YndB with AHSA1/START domain